MRSFAVAALLLAWPVALRAQANLPLRFDMGTSTSPPVAGWIPVDDGTGYPSTHPSTSVAFGWTPGSVVTSAERFSVPPEVVHNHDDALLVDFNHGVNAITFRADVAPATYHCMVYLGDVDNRVEDLSVTANGILMASDVFARTVNRKASLDGALGGYRRVSFLAPVTDGNGLQITLQGLSSGVPVMGIEIYDYTAAPIVFHHPTAQLKRLITLNDNTDLDNGIANFNAASYDQAVADFQAIGQPVPDDDDKLAKAYGLAFVIGALTEHMEQVDLVLLQEVVDTLAALDQTNSAVRGLYVEALDFQKGELFYRTRGYSLAEFPENPDSLSQIVGPGTETSLVLNLSAAVQLLEQMEDDVLDAASFRYCTESPLYPTARYLIARNYYSRNTKLFLGQTINQGTACNPNFVELNDYWLRIILEDLWPRLDSADPLFLYPKAHEAITFCWFFQEYVDLADNQPPGSGPCPALMADMIALWDGVSTPPGVDPANTWWAPWSDVGTMGFTATWSENQRAYARQFRNIGRWWVENRLRGIELGGGSGDDQEAVTMSVPSITRIESPDNPNVEAPYNRIWDTYLFEDTNVNQFEGYFNNTGDVEHAAEYTTNPLFVLIPTNYGSPRYMNFAMRTMRNLEDLHQAAQGSPNAWTGPAFPGVTGDLARHFLSFKFGGDSPPNTSGNNNRDIPLNMKAVPPGFHLMDFNSSPTVQRLFEEWAWAWRDAAMSTGNGKPAGYFPAAVQVNAGLPGAFGDGGTSWYTNQTYSGFPGAYAADIYLMCTLMSRASVSPNAASLLQPLATAVASVFAQGGGSAGATPGSESWAAFKARGAIATAAWMSKPDLLAAGVNAAELNWVIDSYAQTMPNFLNVNETAVPTNKAPIQSLFAKGALWLRHFWPMTTTTVSYTDRFKFDIGAYQSLYTTPAAATFGLTPTFPVSWFNPNSDSTTLPDEELDLGILVNKFRPTGGGQLGQMDVLIENFDMQAVDLGLRVWRGLGLGTYLLEVGPDANQDDVWDSAPVGQAVTIDFRGDDHVFSVPPGMNLVRFTQTASSSPSIPDFDLTTSRFDVYQQTATGKLHVVVSNLGLGAYDPGAGHAAALEIRVNGLLQDTVTLTQVIPSPESSASGLDPSWKRAISNLAISIGAGDELELTLVVTNGVQITTLNDQVTMPFEDIQQV